MICGNPTYSEKVKHVSIFLGHTSDDVNITIKSLLNEDLSKESYGISNLRVISIGCSSDVCTTFDKDLNAQSFKSSANWKSDDGRDVS